MTISLLVIMSSLVIVLSVDVCSWLSSGEVVSDCCSEELFCVSSDASGCVFTSPESCVVSLCCCSVGLVSPCIVLS